MDPTEIPDYFSYKNIRQLVMFSGLDVNNSPVHKSIYTSFVGLKRVNYKLLTADYEQPTKSEKPPVRSARGLIKRDWALKFLSQRPALIVLFVDLNWNHPSWSEKRMECESKIASLRQSVVYRETRIALVLVQNSKPSGAAADEAMAKERAMELCGSCQLNEKQLFIFPQSENHELVASRLDGMFYEIGQQFYQTVLRKVRSRAIPNNHNNLLIRQQFKLGFLSELRQDTHSALRPYKQAYQTCLEVDIPDSELYEYLSVIALLNYKICELSFLHNVAKDAVNQFRRHMNVFANRPHGEYPSPLLASIEMLKWKSKQCKLFADLFLEAVQKGLAAYAHENPGLHFEMAADFLRQANTQILSLTPTPDAERAPNKNILVMPNTADLIVYYGQRPWRVRQGLSAALDPRVEHAAKIAIESNCQPNYRATIQLWTNAIRQYQSYRCGRMERAVKLQIAEECMHLRDFNSAAKLIRFVISELRRENVSYLLHRALLCSMDIAYCRADISEYIWSLSQLLNAAVMRFVVGDPAAKAQLIQRLMDSYVCLTNGTPPPQPESFNKYFSAEDLAHVREQWSQLLNSRTEFSTNLTDIDGHVGVTAGILSESGSSATSGSTAIVQVAVKNRSALNLSFNLRVLIDEGLGRQYTTLRREAVSISAECTADVMLPVELRLSAPARQETTFYIKQVFLDFVSPQGWLNGALRFDFIPKKLHYTNRMSSNGDAGHLTSITVVPQVPKLQLRMLNEPSVLLGEAAGLQFELRNEEPYSIRNVNVNCRQLDTDGQQPEGYVFPALEFETEPGTWQPRQNYDITLELPSQQEIAFTIPCRARCKCKTQMQVQVIGLVENSAIWFDGVVDFSFNFPLVGSAPFTFDTRLLSSNKEELACLLPDHLSTLECTLVPTFDGQLLGVRYELNPELTAEGESDKPSPHPLVNSKPLIERLSFRVRPPASNATGTAELPLGHLIVSWKRSVSQRTAESTMPLGGYPIKYLPLIVLEPRVRNEKLITRQPASIEYLLRNMSDETMALKVTVERIDAFMFDGLAEKNINLLPKNSRLFVVNVIALTAGELPFPRLKIHSPDAQLDALIQQTTVRYLRPTIFVVPSSKNGAQSPEDERRSLTNSPASSTRSGSVPPV